MTVNPHLKEGAPGDRCRSAIHAASQLPGKGPLMWMMPLYLRARQKSDYDDTIQDCS